MNSNALNESWGFSLTGAEVSFGPRRVLKGVGLSVKPGEAVALLGPSGSGKTTLLRLLIRALRPDAGQVLVGGHNLNQLGEKELRQVRAGVGFVHQDLRLVPNLRVGQNVLSGSLGRLSFWQSLMMFLRPGKSDLMAVHRLLERVGIGDELFQRVDRLSGGQMQRVALARALYQNPGLLLADEPVSSVDPAWAADLLELLTGISREAGLTLCVSLHDPELALRFFPRTVGLRAGTIVFDRPASELSETDFAPLYELDATDGI